MDADGSNEQWLTRRGRWDTEPAFSPDGKWVAFQSNTLGEHRLEAIELRPDGKPIPPIRLTPDEPTTDNGSPDFSPDGERIVFHRMVGYPYGGPYEIYTINPDGSDPRRLARGWEPTFSPDGKKIAFVRYDYVLEKVGIWTMNTDGTKQRKLAGFPDPPRNVMDITWGPAYTPCQGRGATIAGSSGADVLRGTAGNDVIAGLGGDDTIIPGAGADVICGGQGTDSASYADRSEPVAARLAPASGGEGEGDRARSLAVGGDSEDPIVLDLIAEVENLSGGAGPDVLFGDEQANRILGGPGNDRLYGAGGRDHLAAGHGDDQLRGGPGEDTLNGGGDADLLDGGPGEDLASYASSGLAVIASIASPSDWDPAAGDEQVAASDDGSPADGPPGERDTITATIEAIRGGRGADRLTGNELANTLIGGPGADSLFGLAGSDLLNARDGERDTKIDCGADTDPEALRDPIDPAALSCP